MEINSTSVHSLADVLVSFLDHFSNHDKIKTQLKRY